MREMEMRRSSEHSQRSRQFNRTQFKITPRISAFLLLIISILLLFNFQGISYAADNLAAMEQIGMEREGINANWIRLRRTLLAETPSEPYSLPRAKGFTGSVRIQGKQAVSTEGTQGNISYTIIETFAGNMIDTYTYVPSTGEFVVTDQSLINTLSTGIETGSAQFLSLPGKNNRQVEKAGSPLPDGVPVDDEVFPGFYSGVLGGSSATHNMELKINSPGLLFPYENKTISLQPITFPITIPLRELRDLQPGGELRLQSRISSPTNKAEVQILLRADTTPLLPIKMPMEHIVSAKPEGISAKISFRDKDQAGEEHTGTYAFHILRGKDRVSFSGKANPIYMSSPETDLWLIGPSEARNDIHLELEKTGKDEIKNSAFMFLTLLKPETLRSLGEDEIRAMGSVPFRDYRLLFLEGRPEKRTIPGSKDRKIVDGYSRTFLYRVTDQFGSPVKNEGLHGYSLLRLTSTDNSSTGDHKIPEELGYTREKENSPVFIKQISSGKEGIIEDVMDLPYFEGSNSIHPGKEIHLKQEIYLMGWYLGERDIYFELSGVRTGPWRKSGKSTM